MLKFTIHFSSNPLKCQEALSQGNVVKTQFDEKKILFSSEDWITQQTHKHRSARSCYSQLTEKSKKAPNLQAPICEREGHMRSAEFFNKLRLLMTAVSTFWIQFLVKHWDMKIIDCFTFRFLSMALNPMFRASIIRN